MPDGQAHEVGRDARGRPAPRPASCWCVVVAGWIARLRTSPTLARWLCSSSASTNFWPASSPPSMPNDDDRALAVREVLLGPLVPRARRQPRVLHPLHLVAGFEPLRDRQRVLRVTLHAQRQRLQTLQEEERVERRDGRPDVALVLQPALQDVLRRAQLLGQLREHDAVVARVGFGESREPPAAGVVELPAVDDDAADRRAVTADELRRRVHDDVGAPAQRLREVRRRQRVVDHQRDAGRRGRPRRRPRSRRCRPSGCRWSRRTTPWCWAGWRRATRRGRRGRR